MRKSSFQKHIKQLNEEDLRSELMMLFSKVKEVSEYYKMELGTSADRQKMYDKAKKEITAKFATKSYRRPRRPRIQKINLIIRSTEGKSVIDYEMIDVYLHTVETAINFMIDYRFKSTPVDNIILKLFPKAYALIERSLLGDEYNERCENIMSSLYFDGPLHAEVSDAVEDL